MATREGWGDPPNAPPRNAAGTLTRPSSDWFVPLKVAMIYVLTAGTWIIASDWLIDTLVEDLHLAKRWQVLKGMGFVVVSSILLFVLVDADAT